MKYNAAIKAHYQAYSECFALMFKQMTNYTKQLKLWLIDVRMV
ncbi:hypothetical protein PALB_19950 [Pseudoalteromonas luteoviolacea B = ATCC 29581]|nr:hypothetical protein PALB_19950 [Pseudoalteromonas luteoviolacea B = ATCC 29581]